MENGTIKGIGYNSFGQLGNGNTTDQFLIITMPVKNVKQVMCGGNYTMFLLEDGNKCKRKFIRIK